MQVLEQVVEVDDDDLRPNNLLQLHPVIAPSSPSDDNSTLNLALSSPSYSKSTMYLVSCLPSYSFSTLCW